MGVFQFLSQSNTWGWVGGDSEPHKGLSSPRDFRLGSGG